MACDYSKYKNALIHFQKSTFVLFFIIYDFCINIFYPYIPHLKRMRNLYAPTYSSWGHLKTEDTCDIALWEIVTSRR